MLRRVHSIYYEPRGARVCGGTFVQLEECGHVIVVPPGHRVDKRHRCHHCIEIRAAIALIEAYFERSARHATGAVLKSSSRGRRKPLNRRV